MSNNLDKPKLKSRPKKKLTKVQLEILNQAKPKFKESKDLLAK